VLHSQPLTNIHFLFLIFCGICDRQDVVFEATINCLSGGASRQPLLEPKRVCSMLLLVNRNYIVVCYTEWPKSHFTNSSLYILTAVSGNLCATLYSYVSYKRLHGLLKYKALLFLPVLIRNYVTLCTMYSGVGRDSSVGIATRYGLDGPEIDSRRGGGEIFRTCPDWPWNPHSLLYNGFRVVPGDKTAGALH